MEEVDGTGGLPEDLQAVAGGGTELTNGPRLGIDGGERIVINDNDVAGRTFVPNQRNSIRQGFPLNWPWPTELRQGAYQPKTRWGMQAALG